MTTRESTSIEVKPATPDDARGIAEVNVASWRAGYRGLVPDEMLDEMSVDARARDWAYRLQDTEVVGAFVAKDDGGVVGYTLTTVAAEDDRPSAPAELKALYVDPGAWGTGAGVGLMERALADLRDKRFDGALLWVLEGNARAIRFYEKYGWTFDGRRAPCFRIFNAPALRYRREL